MFGNFYVGSPLSYQIQAVDLSYKVLSNIKNGHMVLFGCLIYHCIFFLFSPNLYESRMQPYTEKENKFFKNLFVTKEELIPIEKETQLVTNGNLYVKIEFE